MGKVISISMGSHTDTRGKKSRKILLLNELRVVMQIRKLLIGWGAVES